MTGQKAFKKIVLFALNFTFIYLLCIFISHHSSFGETGSVYVTGTNLGLTIESESNNAATDNLAPGDTATSSLILTNTGSAYFDVYMKTNLITSSEKSPRGGNLADVLRLTIKENNAYLVNDMTFKEASKLPAIYLGGMGVSNQKKLTFTIVFPESSGNEFQGSTFDANWTFNTVGITTIEPPTTTNIITTEPVTVTETIKETEPPLGTATDETETITTEPPPLGPGIIPKTGQKSVQFYLSLGALFILLGISVRIKK